MDLTQTATRNPKRIIQNCTAQETAPDRTQHRTFSHRFWAVVRLSRPIFWIAATGPYVAATATHWPPSTHQVLGFAVLLLLMASAETINDFSDQNIDQPRNRSSFLPLSGGSGVMPLGFLPGKLPLWLSISYALVAFLIAASLGFIPFILALFGLLSGYAYSLPPLRLKSRHFFALFLRAVSFGCLPFFAGWHLAGNFVNGQLVATLFLLFVLFFGLGIIGDLVDFKRDVRFKIRTVPVLLGWKPAKILAQIFLALSWLLFSIVFFFHKFQTDFMLFSLATLIVGLVLYQIRRASAPSDLQTTHFNSLLLQFLAPIVLWPPW